MSLRAFSSPVFIATVIVGIGAWFEHRGSVPSAHFFYAMGIIYAIFAAADALAQARSKLD